MSKRPRDGVSAEEVFVMLQRSNTDWLKEHTLVDPGAKCTFRTQLSVPHTGSLVDYAIYRVFEEAKLSGLRSDTFMQASKSLGALLAHHVPDAWFTGPEMFRLVFGSDVRLDDLSMAMCVGAFVQAGNQFLSGTKVMALGVLFMKNQLTLSLTALMKPHIVELLTEQGKFVLMSESLRLGTYADALQILPGKLWTDGQMPPNFSNPETKETMLEVWFNEGGAKFKLVELLRSQTPTKEFVHSFYRKAVLPLLKNSLGDLSPHDAMQYAQCVQCYHLMSSKMNAQK